jgi:hypothetical protein
MAALMCSAFQFCWPVTLCRRVHSCETASELVYRTKRDAEFVDYRSLCSVSLVSMVKATDLWNLNDPFRLVRLNGSASWCVLVQGQVRARFVIVAEIIFEQSTQMVFIEDDHVI